MAVYKRRRVIVRICLQGAARPRVGKYVKPRTRAEHRTQTSNEDGGVRRRREETQAPSVPQRGEDLALRKRALKRFLSLDQHIEVEPLAPGVWQNATTVQPLQPKSTAMESTQTEESSAFG